jgi:hypothetical protein
LTVSARPLFHRTPGRHNKIVDNRVSIAPAPTQENFAQPASPELVDQLSTESDVVVIGIGD